MANFPALNPSSRVYTPGGFAVKQFTSQSGAQRRVLLGANPANATLSLTFQYFSESDVNLILAHYAAQKGSFEGFGLSSNISADLTATTLTPSGNSWIYDGPPEVEYISCGIYTVAVSLVSVLPIV